MIEDVILDFDGTLTDSDVEMAPVIVRWNELISERTGMSLDYLHSQIPATRAAVLADPKAGWVVGGLTVAPAAVDPSVVHTAILQEVLKANETKYAIPAAGALRDALLQDTFRAAYPQATVSFREGAKEFLHELGGAYRVTVVTNSRPDAVIKKLEMAGMPHMYSVIGNARKYVVDPTFTQVPEHLLLEGFPRPVLLRRKHYHDILSVFNPARSAVVGDIFELDHALPEHLGFRTIQVETAGTPAYERTRHTQPKSPTVLVNSYDQAMKHLRA